MNRWNPISWRSLAWTLVAVLMLVVAPLFTYRYYLNAARVSVGDLPGAYPVERDGRRFYLGDYGA